MKTKKPPVAAASSGAVARTTVRTSERVPIMDSATPSPTGLDPLTFSDDLQKVGLTQPQATTVARWWGKLATKEDLHRVKTHLSDKIGCVRKEMRDKFEKVHEKFGKVDEKFEKVDEKFEKVYDKFEKVYDKFEKVHEKIDGVSKELHAKIDAGNKELHAKIDKNVYILLGGITVATGIVSFLIVASGN